MQSVWIWLIGFGIFLLLILIQILMKSKKPIQHAVGGIVTGLAALFAVNITSAFTGVSLPLNPLNLGVSAVARIPGVTTLLLLNLLLCV